MKALLAFETSGPVGGVALLLRGRETLVRSWSDQKAHGASLPKVARQMMDAERLELEHLEAIAVGVGPGSFTGSRVGVAFAKTLAWSLRLPLFGISGLEALAAEVPSPFDVVHAIARAHDGALYAGAWRHCERAGFSVVHAPAIVGDAEFRARIGPQDRVTGAPKDLASFEDLGAKLHPGPEDIPVGALARIAAQRLLHGVPADDVERLEPLYLQPAAPERPRQKPT